jgi:hypothetical protein
MFIVSSTFLWEIHVARQAQVTANDSDSDLGDSKQSAGESFSSSLSSSMDEESNNVPLYR